MQQYFSSFLVGCELKQNLTVFNRKKKIYEGKKNVLWIIWRCFLKNRFFWPESLFLYQFLPEQQWQIYNPVWVKNYV